MAARAYAILSRSIIEYDSRGKRLPDAKLGNWVVWDKYDKAVDNFRDAVLMTTARTKRGKINEAGKVIHIGYIVYSKTPKGKNAVPLFTSKWGHGLNSKLYTQFKSPQGIRWRKRAGL